MTFDYLSAAMYNEGDFALSPYLPYTLVPFYPLFQERGAPKIERNQDDWNVSDSLDAFPLQFIDNLKSTEPPIN